MRRLFVAILCFVLAGTSPTLQGQGGAPASGNLRWSGTVTVTRQAQGSYTSDDGKASLGFSGSETITFRLGPDGVASYNVTFRSNVDYSGQYAVPESGSGTGTTYFAVGYNGFNWEVAVDGGDTFTTEVNHTAEDLWWAHQFRDLIKLADAVAGSPSPPYSGRTEQGGRGVNGALFVSPGGPNARVLSGSHTERMPSSGPEGLDGVPTIPMTLTTTWNLALSPAQPKVTISGPECGCLDAKDPASTPLTFHAGATIGGGEFSEFDVIPEGRAPEIVSNQGGERPELVLSGSKETAAVTLKIQYMKNGRRYDAAPVRVEFCTMEEIEVKDGERDLAFDQGGALVVEGKVKAWHNGEEVSQEVTWDLERMGSPTSLSSDPENAKAEQITFTYQDLPEKNEDFGPKTLTASMARGKCKCQQKDLIRTFFVGDDNSHPGDESPNWYHYWTQTSAVTDAARAALKYQETIIDPNLPDARPIAKYDAEAQKLLVSKGVYEKHGCRAEVDRATHAPTGRQDEGIDCFAQTVRHEWQHRQDAIDWWGSPAGPNGVSLPSWFALDWDHDQVPNAVEDRASSCQSGSWPALTPSGGRATWFTCADRPFLDATDAEIDVYWAGWTWPAGSVNRADWSCGPLGKQWHGRACGQ